MVIDGADEIYFAGSLTMAGGVVRVSATAVRQDLAGPMALTAALHPEMLRGQTCLTGETEFLIGGNGVASLQ